MSQTLLPTLQVSLLADTGLSVSDRITKDARLKVEGVVEGAQVQYSINGKDWTETLPIAVQGLNSVYVRQINSTGGMSNSSFLQFTLDTINALYENMGSGGNTDQLARLDGGAGFDVLALSGGISLDFTRISNKALDLEGLRERVDGFEKIDLASDSAANGLKLNLIDVLDIADSNIANTSNGWSNISGSSLSSLVAKHQLVIAGANNDTVTIRGSEWSNSGTTVRDSSGELYSVYNGQNAAAQLLIDKDIVMSVL